MILPVPRQTLLSWEEYDDEKISTLRELRQKAESGLWLPTPPIVIAPMPKYGGKYTHFLYNGHTRLKVSGEKSLPLDALVVEKNEDIPREEWTGDLIVGDEENREFIHTLDERLRYIIFQKVQPHPTINDIDLPIYEPGYLLREFLKWEESRTEEQE